MLDIHFIRENVDIIKKDLERRKDSEKQGWLDDLLKKDEEWRKLKYDIDGLKKERNDVSKSINETKKSGGDITPLLEKAKEIPQKIKEKEDEMEKLMERIKSYQMRLPNIMHESVPYGESDEENDPIEFNLEKPEFKFEIKSHVDIIEKLDLVELPRAGKISGSRFWFLKGDLVLLDMAIMKYAAEFLTKRGYTMIHPPFMMNRESYEGVTDLKDFEDVMYKIEEEDLYLIATSEHPLTAKYMNEVFEEKELPIKTCGWSACFRKEAGTHGKDEKGIFRGHQFNKIEQIIICKPEDSWKYHEEIRKNMEDFFKTMGLHYRTVNICTGDLGIVAAKKYDLEAWIPAQNKYREMGSCSNCTAYQATRLNMKYKDTKENKNLHVHTLNSTCVATPRALVTILEQCQNEDGSINIPEVLQPYMMGKKVIKKQ